MNLDIKLQLSKFYLFRIVWTKIKKKKEGENSYAPNFLQIVSKTFATIL